MRPRTWPSGSSRRAQSRTGRMHRTGGSTAWQFYVEVALRLPGCQGRRTQHGFASRAQSMDSRRGNRGGRIRRRGQQCAGTSRECATWRCSREGRASCWPCMETLSSRWVYVCMNRPPIANQQRVTTRFFVAENVAQSRTNTKISTAKSPKSADDGCT